MNAYRFQGFTLIELLVVISIIALLVAILLPVLASARIVAQGTASMSNIRQLQMSMQQYADDFRGGLPFTRWPGPAPAEGSYTGPWQEAYWSGVMFHTGYVSTHKMFWSARRETAALSITYATSGQNAGADAWMRTGYAIVGPHVKGGRPQMDNLNTAKPMPARTLSLVEGWRTDAQLPGAPIPGWYQLEPWHTAGHPNRLYNYSGRVIAAYHDGHATGTSGQEMGWQIDHPASVLPGAYAGSWILSLNDWRYRSPWYMHWKELMLN